mgnify:CR=1 FL=1
MNLENSTSKCAGFTLIEVLTAVLILAISMTALFQLFSGSIRSSERVGATGRALFHAQEKMEEFLLRRDLAPGQFEGEWADGYRWRAQIDEVPPPEERDSLAYFYFSLFDIQLDIAPPPETPGGKVRLRSRHIARRMGGSG